MKKSTLYLIVVFLSTSPLNLPASASWLSKVIPAPVKKVVAVAIAPAAAPVKVVVNTVTGKPPTPADLIAVADPTATHLLEADRQLRVSATIEETAALPEKVGGVVDNANAGIAEMRRLIPDFKTAISSAMGAISGSRKDIEDAKYAALKVLGDVSLPARLLLWGVVAFVALGIVRRAQGILAPQKARAHGAES